MVGVVAFTVGFLSRLLALAVVAAPGAAQVSTCATPQGYSGQVGGITVAGDGAVYLAHVGVTPVFSEVLETAPDGSVTEILDGLCRTVQPTQAKKSL